MIGEVLMLKQCYSTWMTWSQKRVALVDKTHNKLDKMILQH
jgi:hypothetical protein